MKIRTLNDLYLHELDRIYAIEKLIVARMPGLAASAIGGVGQPVERYLAQTRERVGRLEAMFETSRHVPESPPCRAMDGIFADAREVVDTVGDQNTRVSALLAMMQIVRHHLRARYTTLAAWAATLARPNDARLLLGAIDERDERAVFAQPANVAQASPEKREMGSDRMGDRLTALLDHKKLL